MAPLEHGSFLSPNRFRVGQSTSKRAEDSEVAPSAAPVFVEWLPRQPLRQSDLTTGQT